MASNPFNGAVRGAARGLADAAEARRALAVLADPAHLVELRGLPSGRSRVRSGADLDGLVAAAEELSDDQGVYYTLNPVGKPLPPGQKPLAPGDARAAKVADVVRRRWLLIDVDRVKAGEHKDDPATDAELLDVAGTAAAVAAVLAARGWPDPVRVDSGNGRHLLYRIDLPADAEAQALLRGLLHGLAARFDTAAACIDKSVHNASRVAKLPGCWARKGRRSDDRPWRPCRLLEVPEPVGVVPADRLALTLRWLGGTLLSDDPLPAGGGEGSTLPACPSPATVTAPNPFAGRVTDGRTEAYVRRAVEAELARVALAPAGTRNNLLNEAAFSLGTLVGAGVLTEAEVVAALLPAARGCGLGEAETLATVRSGLASGRLQPRQLPRDPAVIDAAPPARANATGLATLIAREIPPPRWAVPGILCEGLTLLAGRAKLGKSFLSLNLGITLAAGGLALGNVRVQPGDVLYLSLEDRMRRVQDRARKVLGGLKLEASERLEVATEWPRMGEGGLEEIEAWHGRVQRPVLAIIDVWARFRPVLAVRAGNSYEVDYEHGSMLKSMADRLGLSILIVHHLKKASADDALDQVSGSAGLPAAADGILLLNRARAENEATLYVTGRDVDERELLLQFDGATCCWATVDADTSGGSRTRARVVEYLRSIGNRPSYPRDIVAATGGKRETVQKELVRMLAEKVLDRNNQQYYLTPQAWRQGAGRKPEIDEAEF